jgi:hypothetical protein
MEYGVAYMKSPRGFGPLVYLAMSAGSTRVSGVVITASMATSSFFTPFS